MQQEHIQHSQLAQSELAVHDLQRRLALLGYRLGDEMEKGLFGERTAAALASFKESTGLGSDDALDQTTWTSLKDASMQLGDRLLYLHIPHFRGRDVGELQGALSSMGFVCAVDTSFGPETEQALRDLQGNMGLSTTGILDARSLTALLRLRHVWEGKRGLNLEGRSGELARSSEVLEQTPICIFGKDEATRIIANKIANLARATTVESQIFSASALESEPRKDMLLIGLELLDKDDLPCSTEEGEPESSDNPRVCLDGRDEVLAECAEAIRAARKHNNRLTLCIDPETFEKEDTALQRQEIATCVLDTLCAVLLLGA